MNQLGQGNGRHGCKFLLFVNHLELYIDWYSNKIIGSYRIAAMARRIAEFIASSCFGCSTGWTPPAAAGRTASRHFPGLRGSAGRELLVEGGSAGGHARHRVGVHGEADR